MTHTTLLALDTSTDTGLVVLVAKGKIFSRAQKEPRQHNRFLFTMINEVLAEAGLDLNALDAVVAGIGPGSFVGVRLAVSVIQGLAYALQKPVYSISSLALEAQAFFRNFPQYQQVILAHDARMQAVYLGGYQLISGVAVQNQRECLWRVSDQTELGMMQAEVIAGSGVKLLAPFLSATSICMEGISGLCAQDLAVLAIHAFEQQKALSPEQLQPAYLQDEGHWVKLKSS